MNTMTPTEKQIAIAEFMGAKWCISYAQGEQGRRRVLCMPSGSPYDLAMDNPRRFPHEFASLDLPVSIHGPLWPNATICPQNEIPDYLNSRDAMAGVIGEVAL